MRNPPEDFTEIKKLKFAEELEDIYRQAVDNLSIKDYLHLKLVIYINRFFLLIGYGLAWIMPNPLSMLFICIGLHGKWTIVAHHSMHGGYDNVPGASKRFHSKTFARGWRRYIDWLDWFYPPAWDYEHNVLHHYHVNEDLDPGVVSKRAKHVLNANWPLWLRRLIVFIYAGMWKPKFFAFSSMKALHEKKKFDRSNGEKYIKKTLFHCHLPYIFVNFIIIPLLFLPLGLWATFSVLINRLVAEWLYNLYSFATVVSSHSGDDIALQAEHFSVKADFYLAQFESAGNYKTGGFWLDYFHGYLNYQIEHHLFAQLPASQYPKIQPKVKAICEKYGVEYKQDSIVKRCGKMFKVLSLDSDMHYTERKLLKKSDINAQ